MHWRPILAGLLLTLPAAAMAGDPPSIRIAYSDAESPPHLIRAANVEGAKIIGGLTKDFGDLLSSALAMQPNFQPMSRKRVEFGLQRGEADLMCLYSPKWFSHPDWFDWSEPIWTQSDLLLAPADQAQRYKQVEDLAGKRVGATLGYRYPQLDPLFDKGAATRTDEIVIDSAFRLLKKGMVDVVVAAEPVVVYYLAQDPAAASRYAVAPLELGKVETQCAVSKKGTVPVAKVNAALESLKRSGKLAALMQRYYLPPRP